MVSFRKTASFVNGGEEDGARKLRNGDEEYTVEDLRDRIKWSRESQFEIMEHELGLEAADRRFSRKTVINGLKDLSQGLFIQPDSSEMEAKVAVNKHFFKVMMPGFHEKLNIPPAFSKNLGREKSGEAILTSPKGTWTVEACRDGEEGLLCLKDGWPQFVHHHSLSVGDFVVFQHISGLRFNAFIFDRTACEKEFLDRPIKKELHVPNSPLHLKKPIKKELHVPKKPIKKELHVPNQAPNSPIHLRKAMWEREKELARSHNIQEPHFLLTMKPYHASKSWVHIPSEFCQSMKLEDKPYMIVRDPLGRSWPMKLKFEKNNGCKRIRICFGWNEFYESNGLKEGDVCLFERDVCLFKLVRPSLESMAVVMNARFSRAPAHA
ncbi:transcriptional factor B3 family protein [Striga asiatica]|uniref:Transcriptional factor B3 family protein n=1 Tax=Striga asiatica TaxID=4170 RepID=A0A5A7P290_STRAF|nr:transcriptional factor B3 family protein [Striga asiatica]